MQLPLVGYLFFALAILCLCLTTIAAIFKFGLTKAIEEANWTLFNYYFFSKL